MLGNIPKKVCNDLLVGYESSDDAAVYKLSEDLAVVQTLDFFTPIVPDPYSFGKIAAANALSDIYAMGGQVKVALNIVAFPETMDLGVLEDILRGGAEKVHEAGGVLSGGHSITDASPKYGLSVTGTVHPDKVLKNNGCKEKDKIILTKPLGVGIIMTAGNMGKALEADFAQAVLSMETINKYAADIMRKYSVNACTDVTGFGFMGHLAEMVPQGLSALADTKNIKYIEGAYKLAEEFYITGAGQKNANFLKGKVLFDSDVPFAMKEILYDPQTSGGLLISLPEDEADRLNDELNANGIDACIAACVTLGKDYKIVVI